MYIWGKGRAAGRVGSDFLTVIAGRVGSGRVNVSPGRVGSGPRKVTRGQLCYIPVYNSHTYSKRSKLLQSTMLLPNCEGLHSACAFIAI